METTEPTEELERNVYDNEQIEWVVRPSGAARFVSTGVGALIGGVVLGAVLAGFVGFGLFFLGAALGSLSTVAVALPAAAVTFPAVLVWSLRRQVARLLFGTTEYAATNARLISFGGAFGRSMSSIPLEGVQDTQYDVSTAEKLFDVGTVTVDTEQGYETMSFPYTPAPADFAREVNSLASRARREGTPELSYEGEYEPGQGIEAEQPADGLAENVYPDEQLLWVVTQDKTSRLLTDAPGLLVGAVLTGLVFGVIAAGAAFGLTRSVSTALTAGGGVGAVTGLANLVVSAVSYYRGSTQYAATDRRLVSYQGRFGKQFDSVPLAGIQDAEYSVGVAENLFDVGTVSVDTDRGYERMWLSNVPNPPDVAREISRLASSGIADRPAVDPGEVSVGDGIDSQSPSEDLMGNVHDDESVTWVIAPDKTARLAKNVVQGVPSAAVGGVILGAFVGGFAGVAVAPGIGVAAGALTVVGVVVLALVGTVQNYLFDTTEYAMTDDRLVEYSGAFGRELSGIPLKGIQDAEYSTTLVEEYLDVGDVTVDVHRGYDAMRLDAVANPSAVAREISEIANAYRLSAADRAGTGAAGADATGAATAPDAEASTGPGTGAGGAVPAAGPRKRCPDCEATIDATSAYCPDCGTGQPSPGGRGDSTCRDCGGPVDAGDDYCRHCGAETPVPAAGGD